MTYQVACKYTTFTRNANLAKGYSSEYWELCVSRWQTHRRIRLKHLVDAQTPRFRQFTRCWSHFSLFSELYHLRRLDSRRGRNFARLGGAIRAVYAIRAVKRRDPPGRTEPCEGQAHLQPTFARLRGKSRVAGEDRNRAGWSRRPGYCAGGHKRRNARRPTRAPPPRKSRCHGSIASPHPPAGKCGDSAGT